MTGRRLLLREEPLLTREVLDTSQCSTHECGEIHGDLWLHARCHISAGLAVAYHDGELRIVCAVCNTHIARIPVASTAPARATKRKKRP